VQRQHYGSCTTKYADFNVDGSVDIIGFSFFRDGFLADRRRGTAVTNQSEADTAAVDGTKIATFKLAAVT
jgi:hypothetical protein